MITVVITTWCVPYDQTVQTIRKFKSAPKALKFINDESRAWWLANEGDRWVAECKPKNREPYEPIAELGYNHGRYEIWGGEQGFHAMLDAKSYADLNEAHYAREFDAQGLERPGYLVNTYVAGKKPGGMTAKEAAKYKKAQKEGLQKLQTYYGCSDTKN